MPVVRGEQIELEILRALVGDVLAVDHHAEPEVPLRDVEIVEEAADLGCDGEPALAVGGQLLERQPVPIADLDGVAATPGREQTQRSEERRVGKGWCGGWGGGGDGEVIVTGVIAAD